MQNGKVTGKLAYNIGVKYIGGNRQQGIGNSEKNFSLSYGSSSI